MCDVLVHSYARTTWCPLGLIMEGNYMLVNAMSTTLKFQTLQEFVLQNAPLKP